MSCCDDLNLSLRYDLGKRFAPGGHPFRMARVLDLLDHHDRPALGVHEVGQHR